MKVYWRFATVTIPAGAVINRAHNHEPTRLIVPLTVRAKRETNRAGQPTPKGAWFFGYLNYDYYAADALVVEASK